MKDLGSPRDKEPYDVDVDDCADFPTANRTTCARHDLRQVLWKFAWIGLVNFDLHMH